MGRVKKWRERVGFKITGSHLAIPANCCGNFRNLFGLLKAPCRHDDLPSARERKSGHGGASRSPRTKHDACALLNRYAIFSQRFDDSVRIRIEADQTIAFAKDGVDRADRTRLDLHFVEKWKNGLFVGNRHIESGKSEITKAMYCARKLFGLDA